VAPQSQKLGLGTAQFGLNYGVSNPAGRVSERVAREILGYARETGIRVLDTAAAYGDSEAVVGRLAAGAPDFAIITKTVPVAAGQVAPDSLKKITDGFCGSLQRLRTRSVHGLLIHHVELLLGPGGERVWELLERWKRDGQVRKIGASVYSGEQALTLADRFALDLIQLPLNVFDQRCLARGTVKALHDRGIEVHARSVFLQGLLLMDGHELPAALRRFAPLLYEFRNCVTSAGYTPLQAALGFVTRQPHVHVALVGVTALEQLRECVDAAARGCELDLQRFASTDAGLTDPRQWTSQ